jgi:predicted PurR-regulated permease PerM
MIKPKKELVDQLFQIGIAVIIVAFIILNFSGIGGFVGRILLALRPFYIGFGIAYILNRPITWAEKKVPIPRTLFILVVYISLISLIVILSKMLIPQIVGNSQLLLNDFLRGLREAFLAIQALPIPVAATELLASEFENFPSKLAIWFQSGVNHISATVFWLSFTFFNIFFGLIISIYMLVDKYKILKLGTRLTHSILHEQKAKKTISFLTEVNVVFSHFLTGLIVEAVIVGSLAYMLFLVLGVRYALVLALIIMCTNVVPYLGPFIGAIPAVLTTLTYDPIKALWVALAILVLQQLDGNFIGPRVMGSYIGMDPIWVILSITIGGGLWGILGVILAIPTGAIIKIVLTRYLDKRDSLKGT